MGKGDVRLLTVAQAAAQIKLNPETIRVHIRKGHIAVTRNRIAPGKPYLIEQQELIRFAEEYGRPL